MHIVQVSKASRSGGGASNVAETLRAGLDERKMRSSHYARHPGQEPSATRPLAWRGLALRPAERLLQGMSRIAGLPYVVPTEYPVLRRLAMQPETLFHFHDLSGGLSALTPHLLANHAPVVWTLHDCSPITGGCLYPLDCTRYLEHCGGCPQAGTWPLNTLRNGTAQIRSLQRWVHRHRRIHYVSPSRWLASLARACHAIDEITVIPNGVDVDAFQPSTRRDELRAALGIPQGRSAVLISASYLKDRRKGVDEAGRVLRALPTTLRPFVMLVGHGTEEDLARFREFDHCHFGYVNDNARLRDFYAAADVYLNCTLADNFPLSVLESLSCGTPVLGFRTGGIPEIVLEGTCGALVEQGDISGLAEVLGQYLQGRVGRGWREQSRRHVVQHFSLEHQVNAHIDLYRELLGLHG